MRPNRCSARAGANLHARERQKTPVWSKRDYQKRPNLEEKRLAYEQKDDVIVLEASFPAVGRLDAASVHT